MNDNSPLHVISVDLVFDAGKSSLAMQCQNPHGDISNSTSQTAPVLVAGFVIGGNSQGVSWLDARMFLSLTKGGDGRRSSTWCCWQIAPRRRKSKCAASCMHVREGRRRRRAEWCTSTIPTRTSLPTLWVSAHVHDPHAGFPSSPPASLYLTSSPLLRHLHRSLTSKPMLPSMCKNPQNR